MYTDPIADMLIRIKNAAAAHKAEVVMPFSNFKASLAKLLEREGFVGAVTEVPGRFKSLQLNLKYDTQGQPVISGLKRISKPGQRIYLPVGRIPRTNSGLGVTVISTSQGLLSDKEARKAKIGGEVICQVW